MKQVENMPKDKQFIAVWEFDGKVWCDTVCWIEEQACFGCWNHYEESWDSGWELGDEAKATLKFFILV